jgi:hypothetical protein
MHLSTVDAQLQQVGDLKQAAQTFILEADGALATALELYSADCFRHWSDANLQGVSRSSLAVDMFLTEGVVDGQSVLESFLASRPDLSLADRALVQSWEKTFSGLFVVLQAMSGRYELMNWLTEKRYWVAVSGLESAEELARLGAGEMLIARLAPAGEQTWMISGPLMLLGKLGKPKLAVAIGNFKKWFPDHLYGDAPELLEEAWQSVEAYHRDFVEFFGSDRLTLSGYELNKKLQDYQDLVTRRRLAAAGVDGTRPLQDLVDEAGISAEEMADSLAEMGAEGRQVNRLLKSRQAVKMAMPPIQLPEELRRAEAVTVFVHPRWGQTFLSDYVRFTHLLQSQDDKAPAQLDRLTQKYLRSDDIHSYLWQCFAQEHGSPLLASLERCLDCADLTPQTLEASLAGAGKPLTPALPEIASVPVHLNTLFQEAMQEVTQNSAKKRAKPKRKTGFAL